MCHAGVCTRCPVPVSSKQQKDAAHQGVGTTPCASWKSMQLVTYMSSASCHEHAKWVLLRPNHPHGLHADMCACCRLAAVLAPCSNWHKRMLGACLRGRCCWQVFLAWHHQKALPCCHVCCPCSYTANKAWLRDHVVPHFTAQPSSNTTRVLIVAGVCRADAGWHSGCIVHSLPDRGWIIWKGHTVKGREGAEAGGLF